MVMGHTPESAAGREEGEGREVGRERRNRDRRRKTRKGRRKQRTATDMAPPTTTLNSDETIQNHVEQPPEATAVSMAMRGDGVGVANLPPASRAESHGNRTRTGPEPRPQIARGRGRERGRGSRGSVSEFRMVQIKEEPMDEDMVTGRSKCRG